MSNALHAAKRLRWGVRRIPRSLWLPLAYALTRRVLTRVRPSFSSRVEIRRVVFVCHGNIMRSAFAHASWQSMGATPPLTALSAGTDARLGRTAQPMAIEAAKALRISLDEHGATPLNSVELQPGDLLIGFDLENDVHLRRLAASSSGVEVVMLGDLGEGSGTLAAEIRDPWGTNLETTVATFRRITGLLSVLRLTIDQTNSRFRSAF